jgi:hypothetical protein
MNAKFNKMRRNEQDDIQLDNKFKKLKKFSYQIIC